MILLVKRTRVGHMSRTIMALQRTPSAPPLVHASRNRALLRPINRVCDVSMMINISKEKKRLKTYANHKYHFSQAKNDGDVLKNKPPI